MTPEPEYPLTQREKDFEIAQARDQRKLDGALRLQALEPKIGTVYPRGQMDFLWTRMHYSTSFEEIHANLVSRTITASGRKLKAQPGGYIWTAHRVNRCAQYMKASLNRYRREMRTVGL